MSRNHQIDQAVRTFVRVHAAILGTSQAELLRFWERQIEWRIGDR